MPRPALIDMVGVRVGVRVCVAYAGRKRWLMRCDCGAEIVTEGARIRRGNPFLCNHTAGISLRFWAMVEKIGGDGCWLFTGAKTADGYGSFRAGESVVLAHRYAWIEANGEPAAGHELDHLCRNRPCIRPSHLEPVTHRENVHRGNMRSIVAARGFEV